MTAPLLCQDCEQRLSKNGERWVLSHCLKRNGSFPLAEMLAARKPDMCWERPIPRLLRGRNSWSEHQRPRLFCRKYIVASFDPPVEHRRFHSR